MWRVGSLTSGGALPLESQELPGVQSLFASPSSTKVDRLFSGQQYGLVKGLRIAASGASKQQSF